MTSINCNYTFPANQPQAAQQKSVRKARRLRRWQSQSERKHPLQQKKEQNLSLSVLQYQKMHFLLCCTSGMAPAHGWKCTVPLLWNLELASIKRRVEVEKKGEGEFQRISLWYLKEKAANPRGGNPQSLPPAFGKQGSLWWWCNESVLTSMGWRSHWPNEVQLVQLHIQGTTAWGSRAGWADVLADILGTISDFSVQQPVDWAGKFPLNIQINTQNHRNELQLVNTNQILYSFPNRCCQLPK